MENAFIIHGGKQLKGTVKLSGAKNISLKVLTAALMFNGAVTLENVPRIRDIDELINLIKALGGTVDFTEKNTVTISGASLKETTVDLLFGSKIRTSFMLFAPLLHKFQEAHIPNPGGCRLGARSIDRIIDGMKALGVEVDYESDSGYFHASMKTLPKGTYRFVKQTHTGTELLIMLSAISDNHIRIENAALEPEIDELIAFLNEGGAKISRNETVIEIDGVPELKQTKPFKIASDRNEAATYAVMALTTKGEITVEDTNTMHLAAFHDVLRKAGGIVEEKENSVTYKYEKPLQAVSVETAPHPGFMTDWQPMLAVLLTQAQGNSVIHERMFENRFSFVQELHKLGAHIEFIQPNVDNPKEFYEFNYEDDKEYQQAIEIHGPQELHNGVLTIADLRAGATLAIAALTADGESIVHGAHHLERGYEDFVEKVQGLGGDIKKV